MPRPPITRARPYAPKTGLVAGTTFTSERQYRNALARAKGFRSWAARQRAPKLVRSAKSVAKLRPSEALARRQAFEALSLMRREDLSLERAAARANTTPNTVLRHAGTALTRSVNGRYRPTAADRLFRPMIALTTVGEVELDLHGSHSASVVGSHWSAIKRFLEVPNESVLYPFQGQRIGHCTLETDPDVIEELARRGELSFEDIYRS